MADLSYSCDVVQGFNLAKDAQSIIGYLKTLKIGEKEFEADIKERPDPEDFGATIDYVGVISSLYWGGEASDPMQISCQICVKNKTEASVLMHKDLANIMVEFEFAIYDYDPEDKSYYKCFHSGDAAVQALICKSGSELELNVDTDQSGEVLSPKNFTLNFGVVPEDEAAMEIHIAFSKTDKLVKPWGVKVGG